MILIDKQIYYETRKGIYIRIDRHWNTISKSFLEQMSPEDRSSIIVGGQKYSKEIEKIGLYIKHKSLTTNSITFGNYELFKVSPRLIKSLYKKKDCPILSPVFIDNSAKEFYKSIRVGYLPIREKGLSIHCIEGIYNIEYDISGEDITNNYTPGELRDKFIGSEIIYNPKEYIITIGEEENDILIKTHNVNNVSSYIIRYDIKKELSSEELSKLDHIPKIAKKYSTNLYQQGKYYYYIIHKRNNYKYLSQFIQGKTLKKVIIELEGKSYLATVKFLLYKCDIVVNISSFNENDSLVCLF